MAAVLTAPDAPAVSSRRPALDGLRGIAALVVVVHHALLISPPLAAGYRAGALPEPGSWPWLALYTPLHLLWAGGEAVLVFFVLSGFVLALPAASGRLPSWRSYYPQRMLRLYLPIFGATALAVALVRLVPRHPGPDSSWWLANHVSPVTLRDAVHDAAVIKGTTWLNSAFWSLQWEVYFSLLLPLYLLLLVRLRRAALLKAAVLAGLVAAGTYLPRAWLLYLPIFGFGVLMAQNHELLDRAGARFDRWRPAWRRSAALGVGLLLVASWWIKVVPGVPASAASQVLAMQLTLLGACLVVWLFASTADGARTGAQPVIRWLGVRSFSLYLVHEPIVVTVAYLLDGTTNAALVLLLALPLALLAAELFGKLCEMPSHRLAQLVGRRLGAPAARRRAEVG